MMLPFPIIQVQIVLRSRLRTPDLFCVLARRFNVNLKHNAIQTYHINPICGGVENISSILLNQPNHLPPQIVLRSSLEQKVTAVKEVVQSKIFQLNRKQSYKLWQCTFKKQLEIKLISKSILVFLKIELKAILTYKNSILEMQLALVFQKDIFLIFIFNAELYLMLLFKCLLIFSCCQSLRIPAI